MVILEILLGIYVIVAFIIVIVAAPRRGLLMSIPDAIVWPLTAMWYLLTWTKPTNDWKKR